MSQRGTRSTWIVVLLVVLGLAAGLGIGLLLGWVVWPVSYYDTDIADLHVDHKEEYIIMVGAAYALDGDLEKAEARLARLEAPNIGQWVAELADRYITEGGDEAAIRALATLAHGLGVDTAKMVAYLATPTPTPTDTPLPTPTPAPTEMPTDTPVPTDTPIPTDTPVPTDTSVPTDVPATATPPPTNAPLTDTPRPQPTDTSAPLPTDTPQPQPTATPVPQPTNTPKPPPPTNTPKPVAKWTWNAQLLGPANTANQTCEGGAQYIRVTVVDANNTQIGGVWIHDYYTGETQVTGHKGDDPYWGVGEAEFPCPGDGGRMLCVAADQGGSCVSDYTRGMSCYYAPDFEDLWAAGFCECCDKPITKERCREFYNSGAQCMVQARHYSWHAVFRRNW